MCQFTTNDQMIVVKFISSVQVEGCSVDIVLGEGAKFV
jgi:hypothetical protein